MLPYPIDGQCGRAMPTRYEKTAASFSGVLCLAAALDHLR